MPEVFFSLFVEKLLSVCGEAAILASGKDPIYHFWVKDFFLLATIVALLLTNNGFAAKKKKNPLAPKVN